MKNQKQIDLLPINEILKIILNENKRVFEAVKKESKNIAAAINLIVSVLKQNHRVFYVGAGTSGRLGILDASEIPPTFGAKNKFIGIIAGGDKALKKAIEFSEDQKQEVIKNLRAFKFNKKDILIGITASGTTPYTINAIKYAKKIKAKVIAITSSPNFKYKYFCNIIINPLTGPEIIAGSTRLKAGTAAKMILNMLSTVSMIKLGKTYGHLMTDLSISNKKLEERALEILQSILKTTKKEAKSLLKQSKNKIKVAVVMKKMRISRTKANKILKKYDGKIRELLRK